MSEELPQAPQIEDSVISNLLLDHSEETIDLIEELHPEDFFQRKNRILFESIRELSKQGKPFDGLNLTTFLKDEGILDHVGGQIHISNMMTKSGANFTSRHHVETIKEKTRLRKIIDLGEKVKTQAYQSERSSDIIEVLDKEIHAIDSKDNSENLITHGLGQVRKMIEARRNNEKIIGISTGIKAFDDIYFGLQPGLYTAICGLPSSGKTAFVDQSVCRFMEDEIPTLYIPLESGSDRITSKIACKKCRISYFRFLRGKCNPHELTTIEKSLDVIEKKPFYLKRPEKLTADSIRSLIMREWRKNKIKIVIIDYLQKINQDGDNERVSIARASSEIQNICINTGISALILCQLNRETRNQKRPHMGNIKDSGQIDQDADNIAILWNEKENHELEDGELRPSIMSIEKNKDGIQGVDEKLSFDGELMMFKERKI